MILFHPWSLERGSLWLFIDSAKPLLDDSTSTITGGFVTALPDVIALDGPPIQMCRVRKCKIVHDYNRKALQDRNWR
jgi:hypothetical protein